MDTSWLTVEGTGLAVAEKLETALRNAALECATLVNADALPEPDAVIRRCRAFVADLPAGAAGLVVTILTAPPPGLADVARHIAAGALWAFTRNAALDWAPRGVRVNAIGLGTDPAGPWDAQETAGRAAFAAPGRPAEVEDIARTILAMAAWPSMTGQIVRLGA